MKFSEIPDISDERRQQLERQLTELDEATKQIVLDGYLDLVLTAPVHPIILDDHGVLRWKSNPEIRKQADENGEIIMQKCIAVQAGTIDEETWLRYNQEIGYSLSGYIDACGSWLWEEEGEEEEGEEETPDKAYLVMGEWQTYSSYDDRIWGVKAFLSEDKAQELAKSLNKIVERFLEREMEEDLVEEIITAIKEKSETNIALPEGIENRNRAHLVDTGPSYSIEEIPFEE